MNKPKKQTITKKEMCSVCPGKKLDPDDKCYCTAKFNDPRCREWLYGYFC